MRERCPWFIQCDSDCAACDTDRVCEDTYCSEGYCGFRPRTEACRCSVGCVGPEGSVRLAHALARGVGGIPGPVGPTSLAVTTNEQAVYLASYDSGHVDLHLRLDGVQKFGSRYETEGVHSVALTEDQRHLVAAGDTEIVLYDVLPDHRLRRVISEPASTNALAIASMLYTVEEDDRLVLRDVSTLEEVTAVRADAVRGAQQLVTLTSGRVLVPGFENNSVSLWTTQAGVLTATSSLSGRKGLSSPQAIAVTPDESRAYVAGYCDHSIAIVRITDEALDWSGSVGFQGEAQTGCAPLEIGQRERDGALLEHPSALAVSPDGSFLYAAIKARNLLLVVYEISADTLLLAGTIADSPPFDDYSDEDFHLHPPDLPNPFDFEPLRYRRNAELAIHPSGRLYGASRYGNAFGVVEGTAIVDWQQRGEGGVGSISGAYNLAVSPDNSNVYVAPRTHGDVGAFRFDSSTGELTELPQTVIPRVNETAGGLTNVFVTKDGAQVLAVDTTPPAIHIHDRLQSGALRWVESVAVPSCNGGEALPVDVQVTPDGSAVLVADFQDLEDGASCIYSYPRDSGGELGLPYVVDDSLVAGVESFAMTSDGGDIYAACFYAKSVAWLQREPGDHMLNVSDAVVRDDLDGAEFVVLSAEEDRAWVSSPVYHKLVGFERRLDGSLHHIQTLEYPSFPIKGAAGMATSPGGDRLWLASRLSETITSFRILEDGSLELLDSVDASQPHVSLSVGFSHPTSSVLSPLAWINGLEASWDGNWILTSAVASSTLAAWEVQRPSGSTPCVATCL